MNSRSVRWALLQLFSLLVTGFLLVSIFSVFTGLVGTFYIFPITLTLASAVAFRYVAVHHQFSEPTYRWLALVPLVISVVSGTVALDVFLSGVSPRALRHVFQHGTFRIGAPRFLPEWWIAVLLAPASALILGGAVTTKNLSPYSKPAGIREAATSPVYFGLACAFFGLWAVLFVGIAIQRVLIVAPIFEELLKFGLALLIGSTLFGRSLPARIGVAFVVGSSFGLVEHSTTYPLEADTAYLFRTLFHAVTAVLSVTVYTVFESLGENKLLWIAPAYSIILHFYYNTFAVLSALIALSVFGAHHTVVPLSYGAAVLLLATGLLFLVVSSRSLAVALHRPLDHVLSDLV